VATIIGNTVTIRGVGTAVITATQAASGNFTGASATANLVVSAATPSLGIFTVPAKVFGSAAFVLTSPTSTSSGAWSYSSGNTNVATISGNTVTIRGVGTAVITATQAASGNFTGASTTGNLVVSWGSQTITFNQPAVQTYVPNGTFALSATAPGGAVAFTSSNTNVISVSGSTATMRGAGTAVITANQAGNANYAAATAVTRSVTVNKGSQTISFNPPATNTYVANGTLSFPTTASSGLTIAYSSSNTNVLTVSGATATMKAKGTVNVTASQSGNTNFNASTPVIRTITLR
jgi:hypothetical protein